MEGKGDSLRILPHIHKIGLVFLLALAVVLPSVARMGEAAAAEPDIQAEAAILIDADTGRVLWSKNGEERHYPASMTKMMTCLLGIQLMPPDAKVTISQAAASTEDLPLHIARGDVLTAEELMRGMMMVSDNGAAVAIAEHIDGSAAVFAERMNEKAQEIGMQNTHFANPNGLTDPNHYSTPHDMARLAQYAMKNPVFRDFVRQKERRVTWIAPSGKSLLAKNTNELLGRYEGMTGIKTGWTSAAGGCLAASAKRNGLELIAVVMKAPDAHVRFDDARKLLDYGFSQTKLKRGIRRDHLKKSVWVRGGTQATVAVHPVEDVNYPVIGGEDPKRYTVTYDLPKMIDAPVKDGTVVGKLVLHYDGKPVGTVDLAAEKADKGFSVGSSLVSIFGWMLPRL